GTPDAALLERLHEARLRVSRLRARLVALGYGLPQREGVALSHLRQRLVLDLIRVAALLVATFLVGLEEALEGVHRAGGGQLHALAVGLRLQRDRRRLELRVGHLAGDRALPDEVVHPLLVAPELPC